MDRAEHGPRRRRAFTLIELLTVIAIIAILVAIMIPSIARARKLVRVAVCTSNLGQFSQCIQMYANNNKHQYWLFYHGNNEYWIQFLEPYHDNVDELRLCPEATTLGYGWGTADETWGPTGAYWIGDNYGSYGMNLWLTPNHPTRNSYYSQFEGNGYANWFWKSSDRIEGSVPTLVDSIWVGAWPFDTDTPAPNLYYGQGGHNGGNLPASNFMRRFTIDRHMFSVCSGFVDGSAKRLKLPELWQQNWSRNFTPKQITMPEP